MGFFTCGRVIERVLSPERSLFVRATVLGRFKTLPMSGPIIESGLVATAADPTSRDVR